MTRIFIVIALCIFASEAASAQVTDKAKKKELSSIFFEECIKSTETKPGDETYVYMKKYCECSADKVINAFTEREFEEMNSWSEEKMVSTLNPVVKECMSTLEAELTKFYKAEEK
ncbi:hypothetical protein [Polluticoccus soli]|uniref:hypothetical protein n=1 Tax=Polluticoccus soli TaxID=3034150 RepID=UPI0023E0A472|nr:hypothetical protein [Flavipsychrobacter sp. JY13-12]